jgi:hypothetical protein
MPPKKTRQTGGHDDWQDREQGRVGWETGRAVITSETAAARALAAAIMQFDAFETSAAYAVRLKAEHGRKSGFWNLIS